MPAEDTSTKSIGQILKQCSVLGSTSTRMLLIVAAAGVIWGVIDVSSSWIQETPAHSQAELSEITLDGSTTLYAGLNAVGTQFMMLHPEVTVVNEQSSTGKGISRLIEREIHIARAARAVKSSELDLARARKRNLEMYLVGFDAIGIVIHPTKYEKLPQLTQKQVKAIFFDGTIRDWSQLDSSLSGAIHVYVRDAQVSGVAAEFNKLLAGATSIPYVASATVLELSTQLVPAVADDPDGIAYTPFVFIGDRVRSVNYGESAETAIPCRLENIQNGSYTLKRNLYLVTEVSGSPVVRNFVDFLLSTEGQAILGRNGTIPVR